VARTFSGRRFHALLHRNQNNHSQDTDTFALNDDVEVERVWEAVQEGLEEHWAEEAWERARNKKLAKKKAKADALAEEEVRKLKAGKKSKEVMAPKGRGVSRFDLLSFGDDA